MGYNLSRFSVNRNRPQLDQLIAAKSDLRFETTRPRQLSYKIREALQAAKEFEEFEHYYDEIYPHFTFKEESNAVLAQYNFVPAGVSTREDDIQSDSELGEQVKGTISSALSLLDVIGGGVEGDKDNYSDIYFPNAVLKPDDQKKLWDWAQTAGWKFIDHQEKGLTLTKSDEFEDIIWRPEGE